MTLEEGIKQTNFSSELNKAILNLIYTASRIDSLETRFFKKFDISPQQYNVLRILRGQFPNAANMGLIQERMLNQMSNASRLVEKLKLKKLVNRTECELDRRQVDIVITKEGLALLDKIDGMLPEIELVFNGLDEHELKTLNILLDKFNTKKQ